MRPVNFIALAFLALAAVLIAHHIAKHGYAFDAKDISNHEFFVGIFAGVGVGLAFGGSQA